MFKKSVLLGKKVYYEYKLSKIQRGIVSGYVFMGISIISFCCKVISFGLIFFTLGSLAVIIGYSNKADIIKKIEEFDIELYKLKK